MRKKKKKEKRVSLFHKWEIRFNITSINQLPTNDRVQSVAWPQIQFGNNCF